MISFLSKEEVKTFVLLTEKDLNELKECMIYFEKNISENQDKYNLSKETYEFRNQMREEILNDLTNYQNIHLVRTTIEALKK